MTTLSTVLRTFKEIDDKNADFGLEKIQRTIAKIAEQSANEGLKPLMQDSFLKAGDILSGHINSSRLKHIPYKQSTFSSPVGYFFINLGRGIISLKENPIEFAKKVVQEPLTIFTESNVLELTGKLSYQKAKEGEGALKQSLFDIHKLLKEIPAIPDKEAKMNSLYWPLRFFDNEKKYTF